MKPEEGGATARGQALTWWISPQEGEQITAAARCCILYAYGGITTPVTHIPPRPGEDTRIHIGFPHGTMEATAPAIRGVHEWVLPTGVFLIYHQGVGLFVKETLRTLSDPTTMDSADELNLIELPPEEPEKGTNP